MLFMPVSLMTAFFSTQIVNVKFTLRDYWISFSVILGSSFLALVIFSFVSGTTEGKIMYKPLSRIVFDVSKAFLFHKNRKVS